MGAPPAIPIVADIILEYPTGKFAHKADVFVTVLIDPFPTNPIPVGLINLYAVFQLLLLPPLAVIVPPLVILPVLG